MNTGRTIFSQLMDFLPRDDFHRCVQRYDGDHKIKTFSCLDQYLAMAFAQLTGRESLRDTEACLRTFGSKLFVELLAKDEKAGRGANIPLRADLARAINGYLADRLRLEQDKALQEGKTVSMRLALSGLPGHPEEKYSTGFSVTL